MNKKLLIILAAAGLSACSKVEVGHEGVIVDLYGSNKGVNTKPVGPGRYWIGWNEELHSFPTFQQNYTWSKSVNEGKKEDESISFQSIEGMEINGDFGITYSVDPDKVPDLFQKYRKDLEEITDGPVRNLVRNSLNSRSSAMTIENIYGAQKSQLMKEVQEDVAAALKPSGIIVENIYQVGTFRLPPTIIEAVNSKLVATQKAQQSENELRESEAEAKKTVAVAEGKARANLAIAESEAKANELVQKSLSPDLIQYEAIQKWDGKLPTTNGVGALPFINVK